MDLISIIVPIYKVEPYLDRCVRSLVDQTCGNLEIILVDDGSPDNCPAICDVWAERDHRIKVIHKENGGLSDARNAGLDIAAGDYIAFVDSDDWVCTDYIEIMYRAIQETGADLAACDVAISFGESAARDSAGASAHRVCTAEDAIGDILEGKGFRAVAWNKLYKRALLESERYPVGKYHEDEFFTYRILAKAEKLVYVDTPLYYYFQRPGSIMSSVSMKHLDALDAYLERLAFLQERYPVLYVKDKFTFCTSCVSFYREIGEKDGINARRMKQKVRNYRKQVRVCLSELRQASGRQLLFVLGSAVSLDLFCRLLNIKNKENENG